MTATNQRDSRDRRDSSSASPLETERSAPSLGYPDAVRESMRESALSTTELVAQLDAKYGAYGWDIYRAHDGRWVAVARADRDAVHSCDTIEAALAALAAYVPLPVVPPPPRRLARSSFAVTRTSSTAWRLDYLGDTYARCLRTKKAAYALADQIVERTDAAIAEWHRRYGDLVANGKEGVDYRRQT